MPKHDSKASLTGSFYFCVKLKSMQKKKKILVVVDAPGPEEFIKSVVPLLKKKAEVFLDTVKTSTNAPYNILCKFDPLRADREKDARQIYELFYPDILAVATSSLVLGPYVNNEFTRLAHEHGIKIICFQDFWANHRWPMNWQMMKYWDKVLTPDKLAEKFLLEDGYERKIEVTGNPNFDRFIKLDKEKERQWLRKKFNLNENDFVILYVGRGTPQSWEYQEITFDFFANTMRAAQKEIRDKNILVAVRPHPRDEDPARYEKFSKGLCLLDTGSFPSSGDLLPLFDLVAGMQSTNHIEACYLQISAACIMLPDAGKLIMEKISLADFPPNLVGASAGIYSNNEESGKEIFKKIISDRKFRAEIQNAQKKYFPLPKTSAAKKVAEALLL